MTADEVPTDLGRLWRVPAATRLGRPAELDVDTVVRTAVDLADRAGLDEVTLPKVAAALGFTKMALYRYVGSKNELFELMSDLALGPAPDLTTEPGRWREGLRRWADALRAGFAEHPWVPQLPITGPPRGPHAIGWLDAGLRTLAATGLDWGTKLGIVMLVSMHVRQSSLLTQQLTDARMGSGLDEAQVNANYGRALAELVDARRFPEVAQLLAAPVFHAPDVPDDADYVFGLDLILNGVAAEIAATT
ncbi:TetR/AcrR family transcriptional regulator [Nocardia neocaledoniensis]|uniref:TetR/AcrR family transcriptional regulator n=1 Tax=Nocardia neocaledoniensis TaxID=236511 RepID=UPI002457CAE5|nr:TetR/AcrR family transcriptional regulator [Nocardia neocaledoniensis]